MAVPAPVAASPAECGRCRHPMSRVGGFWFCERCGASRPQADPGPGPLPAEHPLAAAFDEWPSAVALPVRDFLAESRPFHALHRLVDVGELVTRFLVIVAVQAARARGELSDAFKLALGQKARRPTLGDWLDWGDHAVNECGEAPWCRELRAYWSGSWMVWMRNPAGQPDPERDLLGLRNRLAHFGRLTDDAAERLLGGHRVRATETLSRLSFLKHSRVVAVGAGGPERVLRGLPEPDGGWHAAARRIVLQTGGERIDLYPLHGFGPIERPAPGAEPTGTPVAQLYARADRGQPVEYTALSGPEAFARDPEAVPAFEQLFPTREWNRGSKKGTPPDDFETEIWDHSAGLVGRDAQADEVLSRLTGPGLGATGGALWIPGAPGVGKTSFLSLIASALVRARGRGHGSPAPVRVLVHYFKRNDYRNTALAFARRAVPALQPLCDRKHKLPEIDPRNPIAAVAKQLDGLQSPQPAFVFLIDGLDEAAAVDPTLPADLLALPDRPGVVWLFTGRPHQWLTELIDRKPAHRVPWPGGELPRLTAADARRFLEQECGRARFGLFAYDVPDGTGFTNAYLNELVRRSDGLPLYLRFLADQLKGGQRRFDPGDLPEQLAGYYDLLLRDFQISDRQLFLTRAAAVLNWAPAPVP
ncbi:MAG TPA: ATP-binding protein, partial [Gemmata sp.]